MKPKSKRTALRVRVKRVLVAAGMAGVASRRVIRGILVLLGLERV